MNYGTRKSRSSTRRLPADSVTRLDGAGHWREILDHLAWFLRRTGVSSEALATEFVKCLERHKDLESLPIPPPEVLEYARVLTRWVTDPAFIDEQGKPRALHLRGRGGSFTSLVRCAIPEANATEVLQILERCGIIERTAEGRIQAISTTFFPKNGKNEAHILGYALHGIEAMMASARSNLTSTDPSGQWCQFLRMASSERFDLKYLPQYDAFSRASALEELERNDQWFRRHEAKGKRWKKGEVGCVGMGIFVFRVLDR
jgi:Family of unknown function (DUF6502)